MSLSFDSLESHLLEAAVILSREFELRFELAGNLITALVGALSASFC